MHLIRNLAIPLALGLSAPALAEDAPALTLELNAAETIGDNCRLTFVLSNGTTRDIDQLVAETVLFSEGGGVVLLTLFDFGALPAGRPRVRQFQVPDRSCNRLGQVLVNGLSTCTIGGAASGTCLEALGLSSRVDIGLEG